MSRFLGHLVQRKGYKGTFVPAGEPVPVLNGRGTVIPIYDGPQNVAATSPAREEATAEGAGPFDREKLAREVRAAWVRWAETQPDPKPSWLVPYDELSEPDKEADRQIGEHIQAVVCQRIEELAALTALSVPLALRNRTSEPEAGAVKPRPIEQAPRDGTMLRLFVRYDAGIGGSWFPLDDVQESWTIGFNNLDNTGDDRWQYVGWDWSQDYLLEATGAEVLGWLPFHAHAHPAPATADKLRMAVEALERLVRNHGAHIEELPGASGVSDMEFARQALAALNEEAAP